MTKRSYQQPRTVRIVLALLFAPLIPFLLYFGFYFLLTSNAASPEQPPSFSAFFFGIVPAAYLITLIVWTPIVLAFERKALRAPRYYVLSGILVYCVAALVLYTILSGGPPTGEASLLAVVAAVIGAVYGLCYWVTAYWTPQAAA